MLVALGALSNGTKTVSSITPGYRESIQGWSEALRDLKRRAMNPPRVVVGDGDLGIWVALANVYPEAAEQKCWNHKILNVLDKLPKSQQEPASELLRRIPYSDTRRRAQQLRDIFTAWCRERSFDSAAQTLERDRERMVTFYDFPKEHHKHLRTTKCLDCPVESTMGFFTASIECPNR